MLDNTASSGAAKKPYHRGDLPEALLAAAENVLVRDGIAGVGLRAIAREAEVSHTAPKHHFGDLANLLSELAARGYQRLGDALRNATRDATDYEARRRGVAKTYVRFASDHPQLFGLMFRNEIISLQNANLLAAIRSTLLGMAEAVSERAISTERYASDGISKEEAMRITVAWAYLHGLATLLVDKRLGGLAKFSGFESARMLVEQTLDQVTLTITLKEKEA